MRHQLGIAEKRAVFSTKVINNNRIIPNPTVVFSVDIY